MATFPFQQMDVYRTAKEMAVLVHRARIKHRQLKDQAERAAVGVLLQLSEGLPSFRPKVRARYFDIARDSAAEVAAAIDLASDLGMIDAALASAILDRAGKVRAMLIGLSR